MDYRNLGRAGLKVSEICLGTMTFGNGADQDGATKMVNAALDAGVTFFDTANSYVGGTSETMLGVALKGRREDAIIASKFFNPMGGRPNDSGMSRLHIKQQIEGSLKRLQTDYIDVYYVHHVDHQTPLEEMLRALDDLEAGGVGAVDLFRLRCAKRPRFRLRRRLADTNLAAHDCTCCSYAAMIASRIGPCASTPPSTGRSIA